MTKQESKESTEKNVYIVLGKDLPDQTVIAINKTIQATFPTSDNLDTMDRNAYANNTFFFIKNESGTIDAVGRLRPIELEFEESQNKIEKYHIQGIADIIVAPEQRQKGYGRKLMEVMRNQLNEKQEIGIGFCNPSLINFYSHCGFGIAKGAHEIFFPGVSLLYNDPLNPQQKLDVNVDAALYSEGAKNLIDKIYKYPQGIKKVSFVLSRGEREPCKHW